MDVFCVKVVVTLVESDYSFRFSQTPPDLCHFEGRSSQNQVEICVRMKIPPESQTCRSQTLRPACTRLPSGQGGCGSGLPWWYYLGRLFAGARESSKQ